MLIRHTLRWDRIRSADSLLLLLHVLLIRHLLLLLRSDVVLRHTTTARHIGLGRRDLRVVDFFGRVYVRLTIDAILATGGRFWRVETSLDSEQVSMRQRARQG